MLKKTLLALGVAWAGTAVAAPSLDDVTMNIVDAGAFQEIINANPAEIERILQVNGNAQPIRTVVLQNMNAELLNATPVNSQVLTVNKELNQGMVSYSFICAAGQDCQQRVESLNTSSGFVLAPEGSNLRVLPEGIQLAPMVEPAATGEFIILDRTIEGRVPFDAGNLEPFDPGVIEGVQTLPLPLGAGEFDRGNVLLPLNVIEFDASEAIRPLNIIEFDASNAVTVDAVGAGVFVPTR